MIEKPSYSNVNALLARLLQNDQDAWRELVREYSGLLLAIAGRTFSSYGFPATFQDREDAVAEVWRNMLANDRRIIRNCLARGFFLQTLHVLARRRAIDLMRARNIKTVALDQSTPQEPRPDTVFDAECPPFAIQEALSRLVPREKAVIRLFFLQGKSYREISALTGMAMNSIGPTISRALAKLRVRLRRQLTQCVTARAPTRSGRALERIGPSQSSQS